MLRDGRSLSKCSLLACNVVEEMILFLGFLEHSWVLHSSSSEHECIWSVVALDKSLNHARVPLGYLGVQRGLLVVVLASILMTAFPGHKS